jgi:hypothetical protein
MSIKNIFFIATKLNKRLLQKNKQVKLFIIIWVESVAGLLLQQHDDNETYKTHKKTFLREGLQRYVCINIKV